MAKLNFQAAITPVFKYADFMIKKHLVLSMFTFTFSHLADAFIQSDLQMRTMEAIKINKRAICKCYSMTSLS